ncbi:MAG: hypothetical protein B6I35_14405 [Anaerolineaceae bacterium 4572_32.2]|nr:MAG: hypothetical protein B6I35_14405 [Anaerolineaceae bacterium 4572_32.2]
MGKTIIQKIFESHSPAGTDVTPGSIIWLDLDIRSARDFAGANVVKNYRAHYGDAPVADKAKTCFTFDLVVPPSNIPYANNQQICRIWAREQGVKVYDVNAGIGSHVAIEQGLAYPGSTFVGTDWFEVPPTMKVIIKGQIKPPCTARDLTLAVMGQLGSSGALGRAIEFYGPAIEALDLPGRITLASQYADPDAEYVETVEVDITGLEPLIACPPSPANVVPVREVAGRRIDSVFLGSCTNGRFEDFGAVAEIVKGKQVAPHVMATVVPATRGVYEQMLRSGVLATLFDAGFIVSNPGCGGCASGHLGMTGIEQVNISTSNRNFPGKQGAGDTYLASPVTAAWSALAGEIAVPEV